MDIKLKIKKEITSCVYLLLESSASNPHSNATRTTVWLSPLKSTLVISSSTLAARARTMSIKEREREVMVIKEMRNMLCGLPLIGSLSLVTSSASLLNK